MTIEQEAAEVFQSLPLEEKEKLVTVLQAFTLGYICRNKSLGKQMESLLKELKDKDLIKSWYYNGHYHYQFEIESETPPDDIPWDYGEEK